MTIAGGAVDVSLVSVCFSEVDEGSIDDCVVSTVISSALLFVTTSSIGGRKGSELGAGIIIDSVTTIVGAASVVLASVSVVDACSVVVVVDASVVAKSVVDWVVSDSSELELSSFANLTSDKYSSRFFEGVTMKMFCFAVCVSASSADRLMTFFTSFVAAEKVQFDL